MRGLISEGIFRPEGRRRGHPAEAHFNRGLALQGTGHFQRAIASYGHALSREPGMARAYNNLGSAQLELNRPEEAAVAFRTAIDNDPFLAEAHSNLGTCLKALGRPLEAIPHHQLAIRIDPQDPRLRAGFIDAVGQLRFARISSSLKADLIDTLSEERVDHQLLAFPIAHIIRETPDFQRLEVLAGSAGGDASLEDWLDAGLRQLSREPLLLGCLGRAIFRDRALERVLTCLRQGLLRAAVEAQFPEDLLPFACALARQCFLNEYVYLVTEQEAAWLLELGKRLIPLASGPDAGLLATLASLACYQPLSSLERPALAVECAAGAACAGFSELVRQQVIDVRAEEELRGTIVSLGEIADDVSNLVRAQYEESPYPRWLGSGSCFEAETLSRLVGRVLPNFVPEPPPARRPQILVAGCGTGQQVVDRAIGIAGSRVVGLDLSLSSLSYAKRRCGELGLENVELLHGDLMQSARLGRRFDFIECIGVLHHMKDPEAGLLALSRLLKPGGLMRIGLYSRHARKGIEAAQAFAREAGYRATPDGIRAFRQHLLALPPDSELGQVTKIVDFYSLSEVRDLLFHVQEKSFDLSEVAEMVENAELPFLGFELKRVPLQAYEKRFGADASAASLSNWQIFEQENPKTFLGLYLFWLRSPALQASSTACDKGAATDAAISP